MTTIPMAGARRRRNGSRAVTGMMKPAIAILRIFAVAKAREFHLDCVGSGVGFAHRFGDGLPLHGQQSTGACLPHLSAHHGKVPGIAIHIRMDWLAARQRPVGKRATAR